MSNTKILEDIKMHLTGEKEVDIPYLQTELSIYRQLKNDEVIYGITNLLFEYLDPKIKEQLDLKTHAVLDERRMRYETILDLIQEEKYDEAIFLLEDLVSVFEKATYTKEKNYYDFDQMIEYFIFCETVEQARRLKVKRYPEPVTYYMYQLSELYLKKENVDQAICCLNKALIYNPRCQYVMQSLALLYRDNNQKEEAEKVLKAILQYAYTKDQLAFAYHELGKLYTNIQKDDIAFACFMTSQYYQENAKNQEYIHQILNRLGQLPFQKGTEVAEIYQTYQIQHGISKLVLRAIDEFLAYTQKLHDIESVDYLIEIATTLTGDEKYQNFKVIQEKK